jgi:Galactose oxidase, central domain/Kelch motif
LGLTCLSLFLFTGLILVQPCPVDPSATIGRWKLTGSLVDGRAHHTVTVLADGRVLVVGGLDSSSMNTASAELYDPASRTWTATGSLNIGRADHTAILLPGGKVLVTGGSTNTADLATAEIYDPATNVWNFTGNLTAARSAHTTTLLPDGKVLAAGGYSNGTTLASAELYDEVSGTWTLTASVGQTLLDHTATDSIVEGTETIIPSLSPDPHYGLKLHEDVSLLMFIIDND